VPGAQKPKKPTGSLWVYIPGGEKKRNANRVTGKPMTKNHKIPTIDEEGRTLMVIAKTKKRVGSGPPNARGKKGGRWKAETRDRKGIKTATAKKGGGSRRPQNTAESSEPASGGRGKRTHESHQKDQKKHSEPSPWASKKKYEREKKN